MSTFLKHALIALGVLFLTLSPTVWIDYAHHDSTHHFIGGNTDAVKSDCRNGDQYVWTYAIKRPIAAEIECQIFKNTKSLRDLGAFRAYIIAALALAAAVLARVLMRYGLSSISALMLSLGVLSLPGMQHVIFMPNFQNILALASAWIAWVLVHKNPVHSEQIRISAYWAARYLSAWLLLIVAILSHPAMAFVFFWGGVLHAATAARLHMRDEIGNAFRTFGLFALAGIAALLLADFINRSKQALLEQSAVHAIPHFSNYQADLSPVHWIMKLPQVLFGSDGPSDLFSLWLFQLPGANVWIFSFLVFVLIGLIAVRGLDVMRCRDAKVNSIAPSLTVYLPMLLYAGACLGPLLISSGNVYLYRLAFPVQGALVILIVLFVARLIRALGKVFTKRANHRATEIVAAVLAVTGLVSANATTTQNVWNANAEIAYIRAVLGKYKRLPHRIHVVQPIENGLGFNGWRTFTDEFNGKTTNFGGEIKQLVRLSLFGHAPILQTPAIAPCDPQFTNCRLLVDRSDIYVSHSKYGEATCRSVDMAVVDMNALVRGTHTGNPRLLDVESLPFCEKERIYVSSNFTGDKAMWRHSVNRAFDDSTAVDSFFEASIGEGKPVEVTVAFHEATSLSGYAIKLGELATRAPTEWKVQVSEDGAHWSTIDRQTGYFAWAPHSAIEQEVVSPEKIRYVRFIFTKSRHASGLLRIYEIALRH